MTLRTAGLIFAAVVSLFIYAQLWMFSKVDRAMTDVERRQPRMTLHDKQTGGEFRCFLFKPIRSKL